MDFDDIPMDNVPSLSEEDEEALNKMRQQEEEAANAVHPKTDSEIQLDFLAQLLTSSVLNSWERGFCSSCEQWLSKSVTNRLSYKQKAVLESTLKKHNMI